MIHLIGLGCIAFGAAVIIGTKQRWMIVRLLDDLRDQVSLLPKIFGRSDRAWFDILFGATFVWVGGIVEIVAVFRSFVDTG